MKRFCLYIYVVLQCMVLSAAGTDDMLSSIADTLRQDAHSVVLEYEANVNVRSMEQGEASFRKVIAVLDEKGKYGTEFVCFSDKFHTFEGFKGEVIDASGNRVMTLKKSDLKSSNISEGLASDDKTFFYDCPYEKYPYTIVYEWDMKYKYGFLTFPAFSPVVNFNQSLESASYTLSVPEDMPIDYRVNAGWHKPAFSKETQTGRMTYQWKWNAVKALVQERLGPDLSELLPRLYVKPLSYLYGKYEGKQATWEELSAWHHLLLDGRDVLGAEEIEHIKSLVAGLEDDYDKVKRLYDYMGEKMRYVSIQLGIGGLQPMQASETLRVGFGDCKALSYLLKVMLHTVGIHSEYVVISTTNEKLYADYPNVQQMNHVILKVPLKERTLWLECTNPFIPFGYVHADIAGHDALVVRPQGGMLEKLPVYADSLHVQNYQVNVKLDDTATASVDVECKSFLSQYEAHSALLRMDPKNRKDYVAGNVRLNKMTVSEVEVVEMPDSLPGLAERYNIKAMYGNKNGNRLFVPVNPFRQEPFSLSRSVRKYPIHLNYGYSDNDTIRINIPQGYRVESKPKDIVESFPFGHIRSIVEVTDKEIVITQSLYVKRGVYLPEKMEEFLAFSECIKKAYNGKVILSKPAG